VSIAREGGREDGRAERDFNTTELDALTASPTLMSTEFLCIKRFSETAQSLKFNENSTRCACLIDVEHVSGGRGRKRW
jgi:hypothetical protein